MYNALRAGERPFCWQRPSETTHSVEPVVRREWLAPGAHVNSVGFNQAGREVDGHHRTYCSQTCRWTDVEAFRPIYQGRETPNMGRLVGHREWETLYHGWTWDQVVSDMGYVRDDGRTMTAQPHLNLDPKKMWTLDHMKRLPPLQSFSTLCLAPIPLSPRSRTCSSAAPRAIHSSWRKQYARWLR